MELYHDLKISVGKNKNGEEIFERVIIKHTHDCYEKDFLEFVQEQEDVWHCKTLESYLKAILGEQDYKEWEVELEIEKARHDGWWYTIENFILDSDKQTALAFRSFLTRKYREKAQMKFLNCILNMVENDEYEIET